MGKGWGRKVQPVDAPESGHAKVTAALRSGLWHLLAFLLVLLLPSQLRLGRPLWTLPPVAVGQSTVAGLGYLLSATFLAGVGEAARRRIRLLTAVAIAAAVFAALAALPMVLEDLPISRSLLATGGAMATSLLLVAAWSPRPRPAALLSILVPLAWTLTTGLAHAESEDFSVDSEFYLLHVDVSRPTGWSPDLRVQGGGLTRLGEELILVSGDGHFARITLDGAAGLTIQPLDLPSPANPAEFRRAAAALPTVDEFRVVDLLGVQFPDSSLLFVSHHHWDAEAQCYELRVSSSTLRDEGSTWGPWHSVFRGSPCLEIREGERGMPFSGAAAGGRMILLPEGILLAVGDHLFDGLNASRNLPQDPTSDYGKTVLLKFDGSREHFSVGHRNPQGLVRDGAGRIWETEHGPRGGDELNLLEPGANYGWPYRTLGTEYAMRRWPLLTPEGEAYREPELAFVPSVGISTLVAPSGLLFGDWQGDLLIGTLRAKDLLRVHLIEGRPVYTEPIHLGFEIRDLEEAPDGSLIAWTDEGALLRIAPDATNRSGEALAAACASCHTLNEGQAGGIGPNLSGVVGRSVGSMRGFAYSEALDRLGGRWSPERLDAFLADPQAFAPGNRMAFPGIADSEARALLVDYLRSAR